MPGLGVFVMPRQRIRTRIERENARRLGDIYKFTRDPELAAERAEVRRERAKQEAERYRGVQCAIRGCRTFVPDRDVVNVCLDHAVEIWEFVERFDDSPFMRERLATHIAQRDAKRAERREAEAQAVRKERAKPEAAGEIYYARVGTLIKVGWTSGLYERIRSYGADAELLAHYPATRADETNLHRNLAPSRAKGREWYHDDPIIRAFINNAVREHGPPRFTETRWTKPKQVVAGKRWGRSA